jgi:hypothetical protein
MKKTILMLAMSAMTLGAFAQITKPAAGNVLMELSAGGLSNLGAGLNTQYGGGLMLRYFKSEKMAYRGAFNFDFAAGENSALNNFSLAGGIEMHTKGSSRISPFYGADARINYTKLADKFTFGLGGFTGFDFHIVDGMYIGAEVGMNLNIDTDPFQIGTSGVAGRSALRLGVRF